MLYIFTVREVDPGPLIARPRGINLSHSLYVKQSTVNSEWDKKVNRCPFGIQPDHPYHWQCSQHCIWEVPISLGVNSRTSLYWDLEYLRDTLYLPWLLFTAIFFLPALHLIWETKKVLLSWDMPHFLSMHHFCPSAAQTTFRTQKKGDSGAKWPRFRGPSLLLQCLPSFHQSVD